MKTKQLRGFEPLESRRCLTVSVQVVDGDLIVSGQADGPVEITAVDAETFEVTDNGAVVDSPSGVSDDIRIELDADGAAENEVTLDLAGQAVDRVIVDLGDGDNSFSLQGGTVDGSLTYRGGDDNDTVEIAADAVVERSVYADLGNGDNSLLLAGLVERNLSVRSGDGDDQVQIAQDARVDRTVNAFLGDGDNQLVHAGQIGRSLNVCAGVDDDTIELLAGSQVARSVCLSLGDGDNSLTLGGGEDATSDAVIEGNLKYSGGDGNDSVEIAEDATVGGNVDLRLGDGDNSVTHSGDIEGNLYIVSANEDDSVTLDEGNVGGETHVDLGGEFVFRPEPHCFGHGRFRGDKFGFRPFGVGGLRF